MNPKIPLQTNNPPNMGRGIKLPSLGENPPQLNPGGRSGGFKLPQKENPNPNMGRGIKSPPQQEQNPNPPPLNPGGRSGGFKLPPPPQLENPNPNIGRGIKSPPQQEQNTPPLNPGGRSGGFKLPPQEGGRGIPLNPTPGGRTGGKSIPTVQPNQNLGRPEQNESPQISNLPIPPPITNLPIPPPITNFPIPPPITKDNQSPITPPKPNTPSKQPPQKMVLPTLTIPVKKEETTQPKGVSSMVNPTLLVVAQNTTKGKQLGPLKDEGIKEMSTDQKGKTTGKGPRKLVMKGPLYKSAKPWAMPFKLPQVEANTEYIQPTAPLEQQPKVHREPQRKIKGDAWTKVKGPTLGFSKIKKSLILETCNKKEKRYMAIYFNWILFFGSTGNKPEDSEIPVNYFDLDNVLDSTEIKINEKKGELTLPLLPNMGAKNVKFGFDETEDLRNWWKETKKIVATLERTDRSDMQSEDMVKLKLAEINQVFPEKNFLPPGMKLTIEWKKSGEWFAEMKNLYTQQRLISRFLRRVKLFQQYAIGPIAAYINWFFGTDGPHIMLGKAEEIVFGSWISTINDIEKLSQDLLVENAIDEDHLPFHLEDCQISVHIIDLMNWYPQYVHNVKRDPQLMDRVQKFKQYYSQLSLRPVCL